MAFLREAGLQDRDFSAITEVHPLFTHLQKYYDPSTRFRSKKKSDQEVFQISQVQLAQLTAKKFYRYFLTQNAPLHIVDGAATWPAMRKWNQDYIMKAFDDRLIKTRTIKTHKKDPSLKDTPQGEFVFDYNDGQKVHDEEMTIRDFI